MQYDITVIVFTFNSSNSILETLNSIYQQKFKNFNILIADDCSDDNTLLLVKLWLETSKFNADNLSIIRNEKNLGTVKNLNNAINHAEGKFIKTIAGDDILYDNCLNLLYQTCINNNYKILVSEMNYFIDGTNDIKPYKSFNVDFYNLTPKEQFKELLLKNGINAPTLFIERKFIIEVGLFSEKYILLEDYPFWLKLTKKNIKINHLNIPTVLYRKKINSNIHPLLKKDLSKLFFTSIFINLLFIDWKYCLGLFKQYMNLNE